MQRIAKYNRLCLAIINGVKHGIQGYKCQKNIYPMRTQFVTDDHGKKLAVILPIKEYNKMLDDLEELEDIKLYDAAKKLKLEFIDAEQAFEEIEEARRNNEDL